MDSLLVIYFDCQEEELPRLIGRTLNTYWETEGLDGGSTLNYFCNLTVKLPQLFILLCAAVMITMLKVGAWS